MVGIRWAWVALFVVACGASHDSDAGRDATPDMSVMDTDLDTGSDTGEMIRSCEGIFEAAPGVSCATWLSCHDSDLYCSRRHADCETGSLVIDETHRWIGREGVSCLDLGTASLTGSGPSGELSLGSAVGSFSHAFAVFVELLFFDGDVDSCGTPRLHVPLQPDFVSSYLGSHDVTARLALEEGIVDISGVVTITSQENLDDFRVELQGDLALDGVGVSLAGPFRVVECRDLDRGGP